MLPAYDVCLVSLHPGGGAHLAAYQKALEANKISTLCIAAEKGYDALSQRRVKAIKFAEGITGPIENLSAEEISKLCEVLFSHVTENSCKVVLTDVGHPFLIQFHKFLEDKKVKHALNYENTENYVVGGWSEVVAKTIDVCPIIIFSNASFGEACAKIFSQPGIEVDLTRKTRFGTGFYPPEEAEAILKMREPAERARLRKFVTADEKAFIVTYIGAANWQLALPTFVEALKEAQKTEDLSQMCIVYHRHPRADGGDIELMKKFQTERGEKSPEIVFTPFKTSPEAVAAADVVCYSQTGMAATFANSGTKTVQVSPEPFRDALVRNGAPSVSTAQGLVAELNKAKTAGDKLSVSVAKVNEEIGKRDDWEKRLVGFVRGLIGKTEDGEKKS